MQASKPPGWSILMNLTHMSISPAVGEKAGKVAMEEMILRLFASDRLSHSQASSTPIEHASLWRADAVHRARNMAQLAGSLANVAEHPSRRWLPDELLVKTRNLARAYEALGTDCGKSDPVPCVPLLATIAVGLAEIFGTARDIAVSVDADTVAMVPDMPRALILICSELIINALKYGYPHGQGGTIRVALKNRETGLSLIVENDGTDFLPEVVAHEGSALLNRLSAELGASLERGVGENGHGYRVGANVFARPAMGLAG
jgi:two-component sensor histidine kinase